MTETKQTSTTKTDRRPDCVTEIRMGNSVLTVSGFNVRKHGLKTGSLKVRTRITVVRVPAQIGKAVLLCIGFKDTLLIGNGIALALQLVLMGKSWVKGGNWLLVGLS